MTLKIEGEDIIMEHAQHYVVINDWASDCNCAHDTNIITITHTLEEAQKVFNEVVATERQIAKDKGYEIYEDDDMAFDAGEDGYYTNEHTTVFIKMVMA